MEGLLGLIIEKWHDFNGKKWNVLNVQYIRSLKMSSSNTIHVQLKYTMNFYKNKSQGKLR